MANGDTAEVLRHIQTLFGVGSVAGMTDAQLLERFATQRDNQAAAEATFEALVIRHGPMVLGICRDVLRDHQAAEDAFQATFLVLVRKAGTIWVHDSLGRWLAGVARRAALRVRSETDKHTPTVVLAPDLDPVAPPAVESCERSELRQAIREELARLPERYRAPLALCYLDGLTHEQTAARLNCPVGTVRSRLARGRDRLRGRLERRGLAPLAGAFGIGWGDGTVSAAVSRALQITTVRAAWAFTNRAGGVATAAGSVSAAVATLAEGVLTAMWITKLKLIGTGIAALGVLTGGAGALAWQADGEIANGPGTEAVFAQRSSDGTRPGRPEPSRPISEVAVPPEGPFADLLDRQVPDLATAGQGRGMPGAAPARSPRELEVRLKLAKDRAKLVHAMVENATAPPTEALDATGMVSILEAQIEDQVDATRDEVDWLKALRDAERAETKVTQGQKILAMSRLAKLQEMANRGVGVESDVEAAKAEVAIADARIELAEAEARQVEVRLEQAERRFGMLTNLKTKIDDHPAPSSETPRKPASSDAQPARPDPTSPMAWLRSRRRQTAPDKGPCSRKWRTTPIPSRCA